jgi:ATP-binding cassette, subfamily B, bacterial
MTATRMAGIRPTWTLHRPARQRPDRRRARYWNAVWRDVLARAWRLDKAMTLTLYLLIAGQVAAFALIGLGPRAAVLGVIGNSRSLLIAAAVSIAVGLGLISVGQYAIVMIRGDLADRVGYLQIDPLVQRVSAELDGLEHLERPEYGHRHSLLDGKGQLLADTAFGLLELGAMIGQVAVILLLLALVHPALAILGLSVVPGAILGRVGTRRIRRTTLDAAEAGRLEQGLHDITTRAAAGKEIRVYGAAEALIGLADQAWRRATSIQVSGRIGAAWFTATGSGIFIAGYSGTIALTAWLVQQGRVSIASLVLVVALAGQLRASFNQALGKFGQVQAGLALAESYLWLLRYAARQAATGTQPAPSRLQDGITLQDVSFRYPGSGQPVLGPISVHLPAGGMVALVGECGSGKTTLVKLLCKFYSPDGGRIVVDGMDLDEIETTAWRGASTAAFQDFERYQTTLRHAVGIGDLAAIRDDLVLAALHQVEADPMLRVLPNGIHTQLGNLFDEGVELSEGQWQKVALARACMRRQPILVLLDEPTASLDAQSEHAIFARHAMLARELAARYGTITVIVSHRFSTVRMADLILVLKHGCLLEQGDHDELMAQRGTYAELYDMQQTAYLTQEAKE